MVTCADGYYSRPSAGSLGGCRGTGGVPWGVPGGYCQVSSTASPSSTAIDLPRKTRHQHRHRPQIPFSIVSNKVVDGRRTVLLTRPLKVI